MTTNAAEQGAAVTTIAEESPEAAGLIHALVQGSMDATFQTMDTLYEQERQHRQALEVLIDLVVEDLGRAHMGSAREYEAAVAPLRRPPRIERLAALHHENDAK